VRRQAEFVQYRTFDADVARLLRRLGDSAVFAPHPLGEAAGAGTDTGTGATFEWDEFWIRPPKPSASRSIRRLEYAGFWIRLVAYLIDLVIVSVLAVLVGNTVFGSVRYGTDFSEDLSQLLALLSGFGVMVVYQVFFLTLLQATPGKWICGLRVIRADGGRIEALRAAGRFLSYILSALPLGFGFFLMGSKDQKMAWHDMICGTRVVHHPNAASRFWSWWRGSV
jgi:uncharacterized RDD family membrane protein YckC